MKKDHILVIGDTHIPFEHKNYLSFCCKIRDKFKCGTIVHIGDLVDNHSISYHEHDPDGLSPEEEMKEADKHLKSWFDEFPRLSLCLGNHDRMVDRKNKTSGLPKRAFRQFRDIWQLPRHWEDDYVFEIDEVIYQHGTGRSGKYAHVQAAYDNRQSTVIGHMHSVAGIEWSANEKDIIFGMNVGCGIDRHKYAFGYGRDLRRKPILSCGIITDQGRYAQVIPMEDI